MDRADNEQKYDSLVRLQLEFEEEAESSYVPDYGDYSSEWDDEFYHAQGCCYNSDVGGYVYANSD